MIEVEMAKTRAEMIKETIINPKPTDKKKKK